MRRLAAWPSLWVVCKELLQPPAFSRLGRRSLAAARPWRPRRSAWHARSGSLQACRPQYLLLGKPHGVGIAAALDPEGWVAPVQHSRAKALERVPLARCEEPEELPLVVRAAHVLQRSQKQVLVSRQQGRGYVLRVLALEHLASSPIQRKDQDRAGVVLALADELGQALFRVEEVAAQVCLSLTGLCSETHGIELTPCHRGQPSVTL